MQIIHEQLEYHPYFFHSVDDASQIASLCADPRIQISDTIEDQLKDLIKSRFPREKLSEEQTQQRVDEYLQGILPENYGLWVYYPWSRRLVHLLNEAEFIELRTNRNQYKISPQEQKQLATRRIGIVGVSVGQAVAFALALERGCGELRLADFDHIDVSNLNRLRCGIHEMGIPKVVVTARQIVESDPFFRVVCFPQGWTKESAPAFMDGLDIVVDECDSLDVKLGIRLLAKDMQIPVIMNTSDRGMTDIERFDLEPERDIFHGWLKDVQPEQLRGLSNEEKVPYILEILQAESLSAPLRASMLEVEYSISTWPQLGSDVMLGGAIVADVARRILLGRDIRSGRFFVDLEQIFESKRPGDVVPASDARQLSAASSLDLHELPDSMTYILESASAAPSGGNAQPWQYSYSTEGIQVYLDADRITRPSLDFQNTASLVAIGASIENAVIASQHLSLTPGVVLFPDEKISNLIAEIKFHALSPEPADFTFLHSVIQQRRTHRAVGENQPILPMQIARIQQAVESIPGARLHLLQTAAERQEIGEIVGTVDSLQFLDPVAYLEQMEEIRWTREQALSSGDGIHIDELELSNTDKAGLTLLRDRSVVRELSRWQRGGGLTRLSKKAFHHAFAACLVTMPMATSNDFVQGGRAMQRAWLMASYLGLGLQPITQICYLFAQLNLGHDFEDGKSQLLHALRERYLKLFPVSTNNAEIMLFRLVSAQPAPRSSLRRPLEHMLKEVY